MVDRTVGRPSTERRYPPRRRPATLCGMGEYGRLYKMIGILIVVVAIMAVVTALQSHR